MGRGSPYCTHRPRFRRMKKGWERPDTAENFVGLAKTVRISPRMTFRSAACPACLVCLAGARPCRTTDLQRARAGGLVFESPLYFFLFYRPRDFLSCATCSGLIFSVSDAAFCPRPPAAEAGFVFPASVLSGELPCRRRGRAWGKCRRAWFGYSGK